MCVKPKLKKKKIVLSFALISSSYLLLCPTPPVHLTYIISHVGARRLNDSLPVDSLFFKIKTIA
jgi:hypothetical protein